MASAIVLQHRAGWCGPLFKVMAMSFSCGAVRKVPLTRLGGFMNPEGTNGGPAAASGGVR